MSCSMTKKELLENEAFMNAPDDAYIEIPNAAYREGFDEREEKTITDIRYWEFKNQINLR